MIKPQFLNAAMQAVKAMGKDSHVYPKVSVQKATIGAAQGKVPFDFLSSSSSEFTTAQDSGFPKVKDNAAFLILYVGMGIGRTSGGVTTLYSHADTIDFPANKLNALRSIFRKNYATLSIDGTELVPELYQSRFERVPEGTVTVVDLENSKFVKPIVTPEDLLRPLEVDIFCSTGSKAPKFSYTNLVAGANAAETDTAVTYEHIFVAGGLEIYGASKWDKDDANKFMELFYKYLGNQ